MDDITVAIAALTFKVQDRCLIERLQREEGMSRLTEKLALAGGVVARATAAIEAEADAVIAREAELKTRTKEAFSGHHAMLEEARRGLDALEHQLATVTNDPLQSSGGSLEEPPDSESPTERQRRGLPPYEKPPLGPETPLPAKPSPISIPTEPPLPAAAKPLNDHPAAALVLSVPARRWLR